MRAVQRARIPPQKPNASLKSFDSARDFLPSARATLCISAGRSCSSASDKALAAPRKLLGLRKHAQARSGKPVRHERITATG